MDILILKEFVSLAKYLNFSEAAYFLHISQPSLSRHIAQLEYEMKTPLFYRNQTTRQLSLTPAGEILLPDAKALVALYESTTQKMDAYLSGFDKNLVIGHRRLYHSEDWMKIVSSFGEKYPKINVEFHSSIELPEMYANLQHDVVDVAVVMDTEEFNRADYKKVPFTTSSLVAVMDGAHPLASKETVTMEDLVSQKIVLPSRGIGLSISDYLTKLFEDHDPDFRAFKYIKAVEDAEIYVGLYNGINIIPKCYYPNVSKRLCAKDIIGTEDFIKISCYYKEDVANNASIRQFVNHIKAYHANKQN